MGLMYEFHKEAEAELFEIIIYYASNASKDVSQDFASELFRKIGLIIEDPKIFPIEYENIRKCSLDRFPYKIIYETLGDLIYILAIHHHKRRPGYWIKRVSAD